MCLICHLDIFPSCSITVQHWNLLSLYKYILQGKMWKIKNVYNFVLLCTCNSPISVKLHSILKDSWTLPSLFSWSRDVHPLMVHFHVCVSHTTRSSVSSPSHPVYMKIWCAFLISVCVTHIFQLILWFDHCNIHHHRKLHSSLITSGKTPSSYKIKIKL